MTTLSASDVSLVLIIDRGKRDDFVRIIDRDYFFYRLHYDREAESAIAAGPSPLNTDLGRVIRRLACQASHVRGLTCHHYFTPTATATATA
jgi:hypothetical protein